MGIPKTLNGLGRFVSDTRFGIPQKFFDPVQGFVVLRLSENLNASNPLIDVFEIELLAKLSKVQHTNQLENTNILGFSTNFDRVARKRLVLHQASNTLLNRP